MPFFSGRARPISRTASNGSHTATATATAPLSPQQQQQHPQQHPQRQYPLRNVCLSDNELLSRLHQCDAALALQTALADPLSSWDASHRTSCISLSATARRETFELSTRLKNDTKAQHLHTTPSPSSSPSSSTTSSSTSGVFEVLAVGCIACSAHELVGVLRPTSEPEFNTAMKAVYGRRFIYGSLVHDLERPTAHPPNVNGTHHVTVKTACFARPHVLLTRNEQWCFLDSFQPTTFAPVASEADLSKGFSILRLSLSPQDVATGKAVEGRVSHIANLSTLVVVDTVPAVSKDVSDGTSTKLRVVFYASTRTPSHASSSSSSSSSSSASAHHQSQHLSSASEKATRARAVAFAHGIARLPAVVRRRRLGVQVFASEALVNAVPDTSLHSNTRCVACTKGLRLSAIVRRARRCHLCAYSVCRTCWSREPIETSSGHVVMLGVCTRCLEWVDRCDYSNVRDGSRGVLRIVDDSEFEGPPAAPSRPLLGHSFENDLAAEATKEAAVTVIKMLLGRHKAEDGPVALTRGANEGPVQDEKREYMSAVEAYFRRRTTDAPRAEDCVLANAVERSYAVHPADAQVGSPPAPIPANEVARLEWITRVRLMDYNEPLPELDIICSFLRREMGFFCVMVTIVGATHQLVLSCTMAELVHALLPREHTFCQHLMMGTAPFIVRHPEADIRFYNLNPVKFQGAKYYCGIPVVGPDGLVVGSICCVHTSTMDITRMQYDTLVRFGEIASRIIRTKAEAMQQTSWE
ncbi:unnamed protein product [Hyaloperonospora brassicae]|uniref:FYVE-type domain-containing protein n=1 Tax=Hyaloperonospora brassicae TaxID=162125 RepID=A0AAV0TRA5_HYABA|nr:unnamed protein product [Hyaloperonospora brassicae]